MYKLVCLFLKYAGFFGPCMSCCIRLTWLFSTSPSVGILYTQQLPAGNGATARMEISEQRCAAVCTFNGTVTAAEEIACALTLTHIHALS